MILDWLPDRLVRILTFAAVGAAGFAVDAGLTETGAALGFDPRKARVLAVLAAIACTYALNRRFTFAAGRGRPTRGLIYLLVSLAAIAINYAAFFALMTAWPQLRPVIGVAAGALVGMGVNYYGYSRWVFSEAAAGD